MMNVALAEQAALIYTSTFREYGVPILDGGSSYIVITFCPWCGQRLPSSLRDAWFEELDRLGIEPESELLPADLRSADWWQRRGIP